ncbi:MAG: hypothetical protein LKJ25_06715 [Clostridia bacterium]|jgi:hypothetical protein|nr:hypothetical protein [Clostridia bacterium]
MRYIKFGLVFGCLLLSACELNKPNVSKQESAVQSSKMDDNADGSDLTNTVQKNIRKSDTNNFLSYGNSRFDFNIIYPDSFTKEQESDDGDGATFTDKDGIKLLIYGCNNCDEDGEPYSNGKDYMNYLIKLNSKSIIDYYTDGKYCSYTYKNKDGNLVFSASKINDSSIVGFSFIYTEQQKNDVKNYIKPMESYLENNDTFS